MYKTKLNKIWNLIDKIKNDINLPIISDFLEWFIEKLKLNFNKKDPNIKLNKWEIYFINLWKNIWWELNKIRPCIIISEKNFNWWNTIIISPLKSYKWKINKQFNIFIKHSNNNWLKLDSIIDLWSIRQISKKRLLNKIWSIEIKYIYKINSKLWKILWIKNRD